MAPVEAPPGVHVARMGRRGSVRGEVVAERGVSLYLLSELLPSEILGVVLRLFLLHHSTRPSSFPILNEKAEERLSREKHGRVREKAVQTEAERKSDVPTPARGRRWRMVEADEGEVRRSRSGPGVHEQQQHDLQQSGPHLKRCCGPHLASWAATTAGSNVVRYIDQPRLL